jgi:hypothetical protein
LTNDKGSAFLSEKTIHNKACYCEDPVLDAEDEAIFLKNVFRGIASPGARNDLCTFIY